MTGWSITETSVCGQYNLLGGYNVTGAGASLEKTFILPGSDCLVTIDFTFASIDSWDIEVKIF